MNIAQIVRLADESWEAFARRVDQATSYTKQKITHLQFISNDRGYVTSCIVGTERLY